MTYDELLKRHQELLCEEASIVRRIETATDEEATQYRRQLRRVAMESDAVLEVLLTILEKRRVSGLQAPPDHHWC